MVKMSIFSPKTCCDFFNCKAKTLTLKNTFYTYVINK